MWSWADRMVKRVADVTVGTVIVVVHAALVERDRRGGAGRALPARDRG